MKAKINLEFWDNTTPSDLEEHGVTEKFLKMLYINAFEELAGELKADGVEYSLNVEIEDNTVQN